MQKSFFRPRRVNLEGVLGCKLSKLTKVSQACRLVLRKRARGRRKKFVWGEISCNNRSGVGVCWKYREISTCHRHWEAEPRWNTRFRERLTNQTIKLVRFQDTAVNKRVLILALPLHLIRVAAEGSPLMIYSI